MTVAIKSRMTADAFMAWAITRPETEHYELIDGQVVAVASERRGHTRVKGHIYRAFFDALNAIGFAGEVLTDGPSVSTDAHTVHEPDMVVDLIRATDENTLMAELPLIVVEIVSPDSVRRDQVTKLASYFRLLSVRHYLVIRPDHRTVTHHRRDEQGRVQTRVLRSGPLELDPPGVTLLIESFFAQP